MELANVSSATTWETGPQVAQRSKRAAVERRVSLSVKAVATGPRLWRRIPRIRPVVKRAFALVASSAAAGPKLSHGFWLALAGQTGRERRCCGAK